jgi:hypothetical protein
MDKKISIELGNRLYEYIKRHGGVLSIGEYYVIQGCCRAEKLPSGRMVAPQDMIPQEDEEQYSIVHYNDIRIYIQDQLIHENSGYKFSFWLAPLGECIISLQNDP